MPKQTKDHHQGPVKKIDSPYWQHKGEQKRHLDSTERKNLEFPTEWTMCNTGTDGPGSWQWKCLHNNTNIACHCNAHPTYIAHVIDNKTEKKEKGEEEKEKEEEGTWKFDFYRKRRRKRRRRKRGGQNLTFPKSRARRFILWRIGKVRGICRVKTHVSTKCAAFTKTCGRLAAIQNGGKSWKVTWADAGKGSRVTGRTGFTKRVQNELLEKHSILGKNIQFFHGFITKNYPLPLTTNIGDGRMAATLDLGSWDLKTCHNRH